MTSAQLASGIELEYETFGSPDDPTLLLVTGLTAQMISWDDDFCRALADRGRQVVRFDNRDCGLSTKFDGQVVDPVAVIAARMAGQDLPPVPYDLSDMAADAVGLLDHLGIDRAHVAGASMGGMIVQTMAIEHPERLLSVTSIMSTTGDQRYGAASSEALDVLLSPPPDDREGAVARAEQARVWTSKRYFDLGRAQELAGRSFDRAFCPEGSARQLAAIHASGDRSEMLRDVAVPMLVVHGLDDTLIDPSGGRRTAELVPGAHLLEVADMGHDLPRPLWPLLVAAIIGHSEVAAGAGRVTGATA
jgi:pimeloyl-ACP methyl ester carboxylesterase